MSSSQEASSVSSGSYSSEESRKIEPLPPCPSPRNRKCRRVLSAMTLACVAPLWATSLTLALVAARRIDPKATPKHVNLPAPETTITMTFIFCVIELFAFAGCAVAFSVYNGAYEYKRRLDFICMGFVAFEALASSAWVVSRVISFRQSGVCSGALEDEVPECIAGLDMILAMGAVRFGYTPFVLAAAFLYPGP